jgi:hypothetical protein
MRPTSFRRSSVEAARTAVDDFHGKVAGKPLEILDCTSMSVVELARHWSIPPTIREPSARHFLRVRTYTDYSLPVVGISVFARQEDNPIDAVPQNPVTAAIERHF